MGGLPHHIEPSKTPSCGHVRVPLCTIPAMPISRDQVLHLGRLARLGLREDEIDRLTTQLSDILGHFEALAAVDTDGVEPTAHPLPLQNIMRTDSVAPSLPRDDALSNAPEVEDGLIRVRAVLE